MWFSGHFHLSHDFEDSISIGTKATGENCVFVQCGVIGEDSTRDGKRQTRIVSGTESTIKIYTVSHHNGGDELRLDATVAIDKPTEQNVSTKRILKAHGHQDYDHSNWFSSYVPMPLDGCYLESKLGISAMPSNAEQAVCWWHMADGKVLGVHDGLVVEYDSELLSPLGIVCDRNQIAGREVVVIEEGKVLLLVPRKIEQEGTKPEVVHPNQDGSYWRRRQKNKAVRMAESEREEMAMKWFKENLKSEGK
mmetsp:Transcript_11988/g.16944  ORF Transcript_11988/g.16944 Transcript_11988/m.16944 type:complete len:250 (-) Transcript_11988:9-758(-)